MAEIDREKVINDLQDAVNDDWMWQHADYYAKAMENAISLLKEQGAREQCLKTKCVICPHCDNCDVDENGLLKEQEPVKVKDCADIVDGIQVGYCQKCDRKIVWNPEKEETVAFCKYCGKAVKWND